MRGPVQKGIDPELQRQAEYIVNTVKNEQKLEKAYGIMEEQGLDTKMPKVLERYLSMQGLQHPVRQELLVSAM